MSDFIKDSFREEKEFPWLGKEDSIVMSRKDRILFESLIKKHHNESHSPLLDFAERFFLKHI